MDDLGDVDWSSVQRQIVAVFRDHVEPEAGARIAYFGATPIPLAMQLGYTVGPWGRVDVYQRHHESGSWAWDAPEGDAPRVLVDGLIEGVRWTEPCDVVIRISTWPDIDPANTLAVVPAPLMQVDVRLENPGRDALTRPDHIDIVADAFERVVLWVSDRLTHATIHVFAAVPVGLAFAMGMRVSATMHRSVRVYQKAARAAPQYHAAFTLQGGGSAPRRVLSPDDLERAAEERRLWNEELRGLGARAAKRDREESSWRGDGERVVLERWPWTVLPGIAAMRRVLTEVDLESASASDGFELHRASGKWRVDDRLLLDVARRFADEGERRTAARLFFLHEALHHEVHRLTASTGSQVGRLPRVLEELDYHADVWALLQELDAPDDKAPPVRTLDRLKQLVRIATETFWAFNAGDAPLTELEVRRVNRYLIWYWQRLQLDRCTTLAAALDTLGTKPVLELAGLRTRLQGERPVFVLDPDHADNLELGVLEGVTLQRRSAGHGYPLRDLVEGFRLRSPALILRALLGPFENVAASAAVPCQAR